MIRTRDVLLVCLTALVIALLPIIERSAERELQRQLLRELHKSHEPCILKQELEKL